MSSSLSHSCASPVRKLLPHTMASKIILPLLSLTALTTMWGLTVPKGMIDSINAASEAGQFPSGHAFRTVYTHIPPLDFYLTALVGFFFPLLTPGDPLVNALLVFTFPCAAVLVTIMLMESYRKPNAPKGVGRSWLWGIVYQYIGAGVTFPIYFLTHIISSNPMPAPVLPAAAEVAPFSITLGMLVPTFFAFSPRAVPREGDDPDVFQKKLAAFQLFPVWVCMFQYALVYYRTQARVPTAYGDYLDPVKRAVKLSSAVSTLGYWWALYVAILTPGGLGKMFVPRRGELDMGMEGLGVWFMKWDVLHIVLSMVLWAGCISSGGWGELLARSVVLGPGAGVGWAWLEREDKGAKELQKTWTKVGLGRRRLD